MSILKRQVSYVSSFATFFIVMTYNISVNFKLILFLLWIKGSHQSPNFETFECSGGNLPNSSYHFQNQKLVFLRILRHCSGSWKISPMYFFRSNVIYFAQKESIKMKFGKFWAPRSKFTKYLSFLKQQISYSSTLASLFCVMRHNFSLLF